MISTRQAAKVLAAVVLLSGCGLKAPLVLPPRAAQPVPRSAPAVPAEQAPAAAPGMSGCTADRPGSGDEPECAAKSGAP